MKKRNIRHDIRVTNASFKGWANRKGISFPDRFFAYNTHVWMVELKIKKRNPRRIQRQRSVMKYWCINGGVYMYMLHTEAEIERFWKIADNGVRVEKDV